MKPDLAGGVAKTVVVFALMSKDVAFQHPVAAGLAGHIQRRTMS
jgi:hypothetical protein